MQKEVQEKEIQDEKVENNEISTTTLKKEPLDKDITYKFLLKFSFPTIMSMIFMSVFGIIDGVFVSRIIDEVALSAVNLVFPFITFALAIGFMLGVGGNAIAAKLFGENKENDARSVFTLISVISFVTSFFMSTISILFPDFVLNILGADEHLHYLAIQYITPLSLGLPVAVMSVIFQQFLMTEGKAHIGMLTFLIGGILNVVLNWLLIYQLDMGLQGAAIATMLGYSLSAIIGFLYFLFNKSGKIYFVKLKWNKKTIVDSSINGSSEFVTMMSTAIMSTFMNNIIMNVGGWQGVAAVGIIFGTMQILASLFIGYVSGIMPIISFNYGKGDTYRLKKTYSISLKIIASVSVIAVILAWIFTDSFVQIYVGPYITVYLEIAGGYMTFENEVYNLAMQGFRIITSGFIFMGFNTFGSVFFTALNNGKISAMLSFLRTLVFVVGMLLILPEFFGIYGVFFSMIAAETLAIIVTFITFKIQSKRYHYA